MNVFVFNSSGASSQFEKYYQTIHTYLKTNGHTNICEKTLMNSSSFLKSFDEHGISVYRRRHREMLNKLKRADVCLFEISHPSWIAGFLVSKALDLEKPVIALYLNHHDSLYLAGIKEDKFILTQYTSVSDLEKKLSTAFLKVKDVADRRFNFYIPGELITFVQQQARKMGKTKSTLLRDIIRQYMERSS